MQRDEIRGAIAMLALLGGAVGTVTARTPPRGGLQQAGAELSSPVRGEHRIVVDEAGRRVSVPENVRRIVTLAPNLTEIVYALGAQDLLVGVSNFSDRPAEAKSKPSIGMPVSPSLEAIVGAKPDVVLATAVNTWETVDSLARLGIAVYTTDPHSVAGMLRSITDIGDTIGARAQAQTLVEKLQARLNALHDALAKTPPVPALFVVWDHPLQSIGEDTFIADALHSAGAESVIRTKQNWPLISMEEVVKLDPEYIIYADTYMGANSESDSSKLTDVSDAIAHHLREMRADANWRGLPAVRKGHVAVVSDEIDIPAPGLVDVIEQLAQELHPNVFIRSKESSPGNFRQPQGNPPATWKEKNEIPEASLCAR